jgi:hypothetical protein
MDWLLDIMNKEFYWDIGDSLPDHAKHASPAPPSVSPICHG